VIRELLHELLQNSRMILEMTRHDPAVVLGFFLAGASGIMFFHIQLKMIRAGYKTSYTFFGKPFSPNGWDTPLEYLKIRSKHDWSPWPAYLVWPCAAAGVALLVFWSVPPKWLR
jgi:hypothetical protein